MTDSTIAMTGRKDKAETTWINSRVSSKLGLKSGQCVLDVGCGDGSLLNSVDGITGIGVTQTPLNVTSFQKPILTLLSSWAVQLTCQ